jgi:hypothetical protein
MVLLASNYDQSKYFKAADMPQEKKLRIKDVTEEYIGEGNKERKLCVWFTNDARGLVLNRTNNRTLRGAFGDACDAWRGKIVVVFPTQDDFRGRMVPVLRVRIPAPKEGNGQTVKPPPAPNPPADDGLDIPASLRRAPKGTQSATAVDPAELDVDDDLNDEINF